MSLVTHVPTAPSRAARPTPSLPPRILAERLRRLAAPSAVILGILGLTTPFNRLAAAAAPESTATATAATTASAAPEPDSTRPAPEPTPLAESPSVNPEAKIETGGSPDAIAALSSLVADQKAALAAASAATDPSELEDVRPRLQKLVNRYEELLKRYPDFAAAWAAYGLFLCDPVVEDRRAGLALLLKANGLDGDLPVVKNQIGVLMAEEGRVIDAFNYFLAASDLAPREALYHFQIGLVLDEGRDVFLKTKAWTVQTLEKALLAAFARAVELAPERTDFAYRAAEAYYGLATPRWDDAYLAWTRLEDRLNGKLEVQAVHLHRARIRWKQGLAGDARDLLATVDASELAAQKARLVAEFAADDAAEARAPGK